MARHNIKRANPENYTEIENNRLERMKAKAKITGDYKPPTKKRCKYDDRYPCTPEKCPPIRYTATQQELKECARKSNAPTPFSNT